VEIKITKYCQNLGFGVHKIKYVGLPLEQFKYSLLHLTKPALNLQLSFIDINFDGITPKLLKMVGAWCNQNNRDQKSVNLIASVVWKKRCCRALLWTVYAVSCVHQIIH